MASDTPIVDYRDKSKERKHTKREMEELTRKWKEKRGRFDFKGKSVSTESFLNGTYKN